MASPAAEQLYGLLSLREDEIRLLHVNFESRNIHCAVSTHRLDHDIPKFSALSYTWGLCHRGNSTLRKPSFPIEPSRTVSYNGTPKVVTENLYDFLCHWAASHDDPAYLWIDAICIDQDNVTEQSHQVKIMGQIYTAASEVIIWLGPEDDSTELAFGLMEGLSALAPGKRAKLHPQDVWAGNADLLLDLDRWKALSHFFTRTWFSRAWILQEAIFARTSLVLCGTRSTTWGVLAKVSGFLATSHWTNFLNDPSYFEAHANQWHNTPARLEAQRTTWKGFYPDALLYALIRARSSACQDPRDKVYSQLGLGHSDIFPDYNRSISETYTVATEYILKQSGSMLLLTCVEGEEFQTPALKLPSWVPDWSVSEELGLRLTGYRHFHAATKQTPKYAISQDKKVLSVEAVKVDDIVETCETKHELRTNLHRSRLWQLLSRLNTTYTTKHGTHSREEAAWRALMTNRGRIQGEGARYPASDQFGESFCWWIVWRYAVAVGEPTTFPIVSTGHSPLPTQQNLEDIRERIAQDPNYLRSLARQASLYDLIYSHSMLQRPFRTKRGHFGIGTQCLREGDSIWIVSGCRVPVILRHVEGSKHYRLVGGSYTHGMMDGEALSADDLEYEMVNLD